MNSERIAWLVPDIRWSIDSSRHIGDWFEAYASLMESNVWTGTKIVAAAQNDKTATWEMEVQRGDLGKRTLRPHDVHVSLMFLANFPII